MIGPQEFEALQLLRVRGSDSRERLAAEVGEEPLDALLERGLIDARAIGDAEYLTLAEEGRARHEDHLRQTRGGEAAQRLDEVYVRDFLPLNSRFKRLCAEWQQSEDRWPLLEQMTDIDAEIGGLLDDFAAVWPHYRRYRDGFAAALAAVESGDEEALTGATGPSYHNLWFELHEDLLAALGRSRAEEEG